MKPPKLKRKDDSVLYINKVPATLKADFKAYCAKRRSSMRKVILEFMREKGKTLRTRHHEND